MNETLKTLKERRSIRAYRPEQLSDAHLEAILEAGVWAPSAKGLQSATVVVVQDAETIAQLRQLENQVTGKARDSFFGAPTVLVVLADPRASNADNGQRDGSLVLGNIMNAAWSLGVGSCWVNRARESFRLPGGKELLRSWGLPEELEGVGHCVLGYPAGDAPAPKPRREGRILRV